MKKTSDTRFSSFTRLTYFTRFTHIQRRPCQIFSFQNFLHHRGFILILKRGQVRQYDEGPFLSEWRSIVSTYQTNYTPCQPFTKLGNYTCFYLNIENETRAGFQHYLLDLPQIRITSVSSSFIITFFCWREFVAQPSSFTLNMFKFLLRISLNF